MSEDLKTIKELADEIGVSKQAVWQKIKKESSIDLRQFTSKKGNTVYVDVDGQKVIKSAFLFFSSFSQSFRASFGRKKLATSIILVASYFFRDCIPLLQPV